MSDYFLHHISLICLSQYCALMCCFVLYLLDIAETWFWIRNNCCKISGKRLVALLGESNLGRVDGRGSATERKPGNDRPKTARTEEKKDTLSC